MSFAVGVVCGRCDRYSAFGTTACACGQALSLVTATAPAPAHPAPAAPAELPPLLEPPPLLSEDDALGADAAPASEPGPKLFAKEDLKPRRAPSGPRLVALPAAGDDPASESGVSSSFAPFDAGPLATATPPAGSSREELMEQAKNYVCRSCSTPVPLGHKFCGRCGAAIPTEIANARTQFFGQLQMPGKAKLILIRGDGVEGLSYQLNAEQHIVGRNGQLVFPDDPFVSPRHANLFYRSGRLVVRDEGSINGVFWRVRGTMDIAAGDLFLAGEQLFRVEGPPRPNDGPGPDGTYFYSSPKHQATFKVIQFLQGGAPGMAACARGNSVQIGREGSDLNFPGDAYMSATHCKVEDNGGRLTLTDVNSRNGTYIRLKAEKELAHGDYVFIGRKLLRVEITAN